MNTTYLKPTFRALPGLYLVLNCDLVILDATDAYLRAALSSREQLVGQHVLQAFPANPAISRTESLQVLEQSLRHVLQYREPHKMPTIRYDVVNGHDGSTSSFEERYWSSTNTPVFDETTGAMAYILHETHDITEHVRQRQSNLYSQEHLKMLSSAIHAANWELDIEQDVIYWGANLYDVFGYTPQELGTEGDAWDKLVHPDDLQGALKAMEQAQKTGATTLTMEYRFAKAGGEYAHVIDKCFLIYDSHGKPVRMIGSMIDMSASKQAEQALRESDKRFHGLLEALPHMAWTAHPNGKISFFNQSWYSYTGMLQGQTEGWVSVVHPEDTAHVITAWHDALTSGYYERECRIRSSIDGQYRWFLERAEPLYDEKGSIKLWIGTYTDIDEQKQAMEQIQRRDRRLENILKLSPANLCLLQGPDQICRFITPGVYTMYGNRRYLGRPAREIWPELEQFDFHQMLSYVYHQGKAVQIEAYKLVIDRQQNGELADAWFNFKYQPISDSEGHTEGVLISAIEVTELIQARQKIAELELALQQQNLSSSP
ncbi:PAS domain-containing protein [Pontibacter beigongshangensis]|uniref:PAS domain-containing protein n=1 Tax=Pontibacter beigongshangensis TaxID=2574733 RepID=UPI00164F9E51|nr:PAS domain-containing protein [Pontibacter beigongshangensis]